MYEDDNPFRPLAAVAFSFARFDVASTLTHRGGLQGYAPSSMGVISRGNCSQYTVLQGVKSALEGSLTGVYFFKQAVRDRLLYIMAKKVTLSPVAASQ